MYKESNPLVQIVLSKRSAFKCKICNFEVSSPSLKTAYFGADLQNANNILKTTGILAMWELVNEPENHFINTKSAQKSTTTTTNIRHGVPGVVVWPSALPSCMRELGG